MLVLTMNLILSIFLQAQLSYNIEKFLANDGSEGDHYGESVSLYKGYAIIGASGGYVEGGKAYIYKNINGIWEEDAILTAPDDDDITAFGLDVAIYDNIAAVTGWGVETNFTYFYKRISNEWVQTQKIDMQTSSVQNLHLNLTDEFLIFSDSNVETPENFQGTVSVLKNNNGVWELDQVLTTSTPIENAYFGSSICLYEDYLVIGADGRNVNGIWAGSVYIFRYNGTSWIHQTILLASDGETDDGFGKSVDMYNNKIVVGASHDDVNTGYATGSVYVFTENTGYWTESAKITAEDGESYDYFGASVSIYEDLIVIGAPEDLNNSSYYGSLTVFQYDGNSWLKQFKFIGNAENQGHYVGASVAMNEDYTLAGAPNSSDFGMFSGSAFILEDIATGITSSTFDKLTIYPNPSKGLIRFADLKNVQKIEIMDLSGKIVKSYIPITSVNSIDISKLKTGVYMLKAYQDYGIYLEKIVKE